MTLILVSRTGARGLDTSSDTARIHPPTRTLELETSGVHRDRRGETPQDVREEDGMHTTKASKTTEQLSGESSHDDTEEEIPFSRQLETRSPWVAQQSPRRNKGAASSARRESDRELQAFISMRNQVDKATEEWEQLNYDIHTLRYTRREVRARWKKILLQMGYQSEADALLDVNKQSYFNRDQEGLARATELLTQLLEHTSLFPVGTGHRTRYLCVMDRLVSLDSAEDFVRLAVEKYPKRQDG